MAAGVMVMQRGASAAPLRPRRSVGEYALHSISLSAGVNAEVCGGVMSGYMEKSAELARRIRRRI